MTAVLILTTSDSKTVTYSVNSFLEHEHVFRIYLVYQGGRNHPSLIEMLREKGHHVFMENVDSVTKLRNKYLSEIDEEYLLRADDDIIVDRHYKINEMIEFIGRKPNSFVSDLEIQIGNGKGLFSEEMSDAQGYLYTFKGLLFKKFISGKKMIRNDQQFVPVDFSRNLLLSKTENFRRVGWNPEIEFEGEHLDFMLRLKKRGYGLFTCTDSWHFHFDSLKLVYRKKREVEEGHRQLRTQHNLRSIINIRSFKVYFNKIILNFFADRHAKN